MSGRGGCPFCLRPDIDPKSYTTDSRVRADTRSRQQRPTSLAAGAAPNSHPYLAV